MARCRGTTDLKQTLSSGVATTCNKACTGGGADCGGWYVNNVYTLNAPLEWTNQGCFKDDSSRKLAVILGAGALVSSMTIEKCSKLAFNAGYPVFGLQNGDTCW